MERKKKQLGGTIIVEKDKEDIELLDKNIIFEGNDNNIQSPIILIYNLV